MGFSTIVSHLLQTFGFGLLHRSPRILTALVFPVFLGLLSSVSRPCKLLLVLLKIAWKVIDGVDHNKPKSRIV